MKRSGQLLLVAIAFDIYWALVVMFRERGIFLWLALAILAFMRLSQIQRRYALLLAVSGCVLDTVWVLTGLIAFNSETLFPLWMVALWIMFATVWTWLTGISTLSRKSLVLLATLGGPTAYVIGEHLGAISFLMPAALVFSVMVAGWLVIMLFFHLLMRRTSCAR